MQTSLRIRPLLPLALLTLAAISSADQQYEVISIGTLPGSDYSLINGINNNGKIVGTAYGNSSTRGWSWTENFGMQQIYGFGYDSTTASDINDLDVATGTFTDNGITKGYRHWQGAWWHLSPIPGQSEAAPNGINNLNQTVGVSDFGIDSQATGWLPILPDTPGFALPSYGPQEASSARAINDQGVSVGRARLGGTHRATIFQNNNTIFDLHGLLPGSVTFSQATDINESGWVVGEYTNETGGYGFVYNLELGMVSVGPAGEQNGFRAVNENGIAVGSNSLTAVVWHSSTGLQDLNSLIDPNSGWDLRSARDINDNGWIIGQGLYNGNITTYLARPTDAVPEPASMTILALGIGTLIARRRRK